MHKHLIDSFFDKNTVSENIPSAQALVHVNLLIDSDFEESDKLFDMASEYYLEGDDSRRAAADAEKAAIESVTSGSEIIRFMRRNIEPSNRNTLIKKACLFENETVPEIVKLIKTSLNDLFIEISIRVLCLCSLNVSHEIIEMFEEMCNPYAQSLLLLAIGSRADEDKIP